jgi:hypothetical protein
LQALTSKRLANQCSPLPKMYVNISPASLIEKVFPDGVLLVIVKWNWSKDKGGTGLGRKKENQLIE